MHIFLDPWLKPFWLQTPVDRFIKGFEEFLLLLLICVIGALISAPRQRKPTARPGS